MKVVVTILQCRRAVLPHIFLEHALPRMRANFSGSIETVLIQHRADASGGKTKLESITGQSDKNKGLKTVREWTEEGKYRGADEIIGHNRIHRPYPSIPNYHLGVKAALDRDADFHLWLEDDALVCDPTIDHWDRLLGGREVGVYTNFHHISSAYFVSRPSFDRRIEPRLADYRAWRFNGLRIEPFLRSQLRTKRARLQNRYAVRYHHRYVPYIGLRYVIDALREWAPETIPLLAVDYGDEVFAATPVTPEEMAAHARTEKNKWMDHFWVAYEGFRQRYVLPDSLPQRYR